MLCGNRNAHPDPLWVESVADVRACYAGNGGSCGDLVDHGFDEDGGPIHLPCQAHAVFTERGFTCAAGHEHVNMETRWREGWDYVTEDEAAGFVKHTGRAAVLMDGRAWVG